MNKQEQEALRIEYTALNDKLTEITLSIKNSTDPAAMSALREDYRAVNDKRETIMCKILNAKP